MKVFTAEQMRAFDKAATQEYGIPSIVLMENAALRVVEFLEMKFSPLKDKRIVILCGKGNNGGDGFAIARHLPLCGSRPLVLVNNWHDDYQGDALTNWQILNDIEIPVGSNEAHISLETSDLFNEDKKGFSASLRSEILQADFVIDAVFGTGFRGQMPENYRRVFELFKTSSAIKISVDIPSGTNSNNGEATTDPINADYTITFAAPKCGMFLRDGLEKSGEIWVGEIGTPPRLMEETQTGCECITREKASTLIPQRPLDSHKGDAGRVLLIGGSFGMSGAPTLAANAVLKSGAGLCIAALPEKVLPIFASAFAEATSHALPCNEKGQLTEEAFDELPELWKNVNAVALGPGIGRDKSTLKLVQQIVNECPQPLIIDADALYALRAIADDFKKREAATILTPHPGEMGELMAIKTSEVQENRIETAIACAQKYNAIVVLKGSRSIVALPDGSTHINLTGNSGMATGGSGDVLTGTVAGLLAQMKDAQNATLLGVYLHGMAGDLAFETSGNGLIAGDIANNLPRALVELGKAVEPPINARLRKLE